mmetsp:Transcript_21363/g.81481  ORF Transcript_21363/g.81481 Transcript_21363/m.81481 type:complete len:265 (+) Transcript_21363:594-1388(+)
MASAALAQPSEGGATRALSGRGDDAANDDKGDGTAAVASASSVCITLTRVGATHDMALWEAALQHPRREEEPAVARADPSVSPAAAGAGDAAGAAASGASAAGDDCRRGVLRTRSSTVETMSGAQASLHIRRHPLGAPVAESRSCIARWSAATETQNGGSLKRATSRTRTESVAASKAAMGLKWPPPVWLRARRLNDVTSTEAVERPAASAMLRNSATDIAPDGALGHPGLPAHFGEPPVAPAQAWSPSSAAGGAGRRTSAPAP